MIRKLLLTLILGVTTTAITQENCVYLASDVYPGSYGSLPVSITEFNGALYFRCTGNNQGPELWKYENGVSTIIEDLNPGIAGSMPNQLTVMGGNLYFTASTGTTGLELYKYDGVSVSVAADIMPGSGGSFINHLTVIGTELYFVADDGINGLEPWKFDGTTATLVADVNPGSIGCNAGEFAGAGGFVYFTGYHPSYGYELWKYDGTTAVVQDLYPGTDGSDLAELTTIGSKICFRATNGTQGYELWTHDGVAPVCLDVCTTGPGDFTPWEFVYFNSAVYFRGFETGTGYELWKYDGTTTTLVQDVFVGGGNAHPNHLTAGTNFLYFAANNGTAGNELWMTDGTTASLVSDINPGSSESMPYSVTENFVTVGDNIFVIADNGASGNEIWRYDGTSIYMSKDIIPGSTSSNPSGMVSFGNSLFFMADDQVAGGELWEWNLDAVLVDTFSVSSCGDYTSPGGTVYSGDGDYVIDDVIPSQSCPGCDSLIHIELTIGDPADSLFILTCEDYYSPGGNVYTFDGNYVFTDTVPSIACPGEDSIISIDLTIVDALNASVFAFDGIAFVSQAGAQYQWLDCDNGMAPIPGANEQDFIPVDDGNYACEVSTGTCADTSICVFVESTFGMGLNDDANSDISVYPNPVTERLIVSNNPPSILSVRIFNTLGEEIYSKENQTSDKMEIDMSIFSKGIYHIEISTADGKYIRKVVKD